MGSIKEIEIKIPNLGEAESTEVIEISVSVGDKVSANDPLIVLESEKAAMEVPSDFSGTVTKINIKEGDSVSEGQPFIYMEVDNKSSQENIIKDDLQKGEPSQKDERAKSNELLNQSDNKPINTSSINAGPAVRKIARELDIDLSRLNGSGKNSMITKDDLKNFIHSSKPNGNNYADINILKEHGSYNLEKQSKIRSLGAKNLHDSWVSIPHVTHFEEVDITFIEKQRKEMNAKSKVKITPLAYLVTNTAKALKEFPIFNSSLVGEGELMIKKYINIGIAVDTSDGLLVPVIKSADELSIEEAAENIIHLAEKAKNKKLLQKNLSGGTFSISSLGFMGGTGFTPIINPPEVAIIGVSRAKKVLSIVDGEVTEKNILPISLSYDHRVINGADAGNFMNFLKVEIEKGVT